MQESGVRSVFNLGSRIAQVAKLVGGKKVLAQRTSISESQLYRYISGQSQPTAQPLTEIAAAGDVSLDWLINGVGENPLTSVETKKGQTKSVRTSTEIPFIQEPKENEYEVSDSSIKYRFKTSWLGRQDIDPLALRMHEIVGDSMLPTMSHGDIVVIDTMQKDIMTDSLFAFLVKGNVVVRRVKFLMDGSLVLSSDNRNYDTEAIDRADIIDLDVLGRVVWAGHPL